MPMHGAYKQVDVLFDKKTVPYCRQYSKEIT